MQDLRQRMNENGLFEIAVKNGDFDTVNGFETAILVSLYTDARRTEADVSDPLTRGGWIGNWRTAKEPRELGGLCWTVEHERLTQNVLNLAREYATRSLEWMVKDGVCRNVEVETEAHMQEKIKYLITIIARDGIKYDYIYIWSKTNAFTHSATFNA